MQARGLVAVVSLVALAIAAPPPSRAQAPDRDLQRALERLQEQDTGGALEILDALLEAHPGQWQVHFLRGMALGQRGDDREARDAFLVAADLNPGYAEAHVRAAIASFRLEDYETAWEQSILAHVAGDDMSAEFAELRRVSREPRDFEIRINAPRVWVGELDIEELMKVRAAEEILRQAQAELAELRRQLLLVLRDSPSFGLVSRVGAAQYVAEIKIDDLGDMAFDEFEEPYEQSIGGAGIEGAAAADTPRSPDVLGQSTRRVVAHLKLLVPDQEEPEYRRRFTIEDITQVLGVNTELRRQVGYLEAWWAERR